ncbi:MAG: hypothetical protein NC301_07245 [Bacteroides sp.]|nr:hypothetical protein [Bacteroides sp.]MCM1379964.1 hypothetical protein [Bacteroides sp.]MCM1446281.1 hypothetical protein [Prevotella sp.]
MKIKISALTMLVALGAAAQDLNTEIIVNHEVVPEEQAATRMRWSPTVTLPKINSGRLPVASRFMPASLTPFINPLSAAQYADSVVKTPWKGYAAMGYGPIYNLAASAGYRFVDKENLYVDGYLQFDGQSYTTKYYSLPYVYDDRVCFRRNTVLAGGNTNWKVGKGALDASLLYQFSGYNFPIFDLATKLTDKHQIDANIVKIKIGWGSHLGSFDYYVRHNYETIQYGKGGANNNCFDLKAGLVWKAAEVSSWSLDAGFSLDHSSLLGNKGIVHIQPKYSYTTQRLSLKLGLDLDVSTGNTTNSPMMLVAPDLDFNWQTWTYIGLWAKLNGRIDDNSRTKIFDEQPYLLADFDAGMSKIYNGEVGLTFGPFRGARIDVFGGYTMAYDWYMPALETGYMSAMDVKGWHWGAALSYDYRHYLSLNARAEIAEHPDGKYSRGYAPWRDHAGFNLTANATVRPISALDITIGYQLRTGRQKQLPNDKNMNLRTIGNFTAGVTYKITPQWSAFLRGENLLNKHWYLGPAVPNQGIMGMIGVTYKF